jgi:hypothetical protein
LLCFAFWATAENILPGNSGRYNMNFGSISISPQCFLLWTSLFYLIGRTFQNTRRNSVWISIAEISIQKCKWNSYYFPTLKKKRLILKFPHENLSFWGSVWWLMSIIPATQEAEVERLQPKSISGKRVSPYLKKD